MPRGENSKLQVSAVRYLFTTMIWKALENRNLFMKNFAAKPISRHEYQAYNFTDTISDGLLKYNPLADRL